MGVWMVGRPRVPPYSVGMGLRSREWYGQHPRDADGRGLPSDRRNCRRKKFPATFPASGFVAFSRYFWLVPTKDGDVGRKMVRLDDDRWWSCAGGSSVSRLCGFGSVTAYVPGSFEFGERVVFGSTERSAYEW